MKEKLNNILKKRPDYLKDSSLSFKSKALRFIGYSLIGSPVSYGLPKDFYDMPADREMPNPKHFNQDILAKNIKNNNIRRQVLAKTCRISSLILILLFLLMFGIGFLSHGVKQISARENFNRELKHSNPMNRQIENKNIKESSSTPSLKTCDDIIDLYYSGQRRSITDAEMDKCGIKRG